MTVKRSTCDIAQERLDVAMRKLAKNRHGQKELERLSAEAKDREGELERLVEHLASHPALSDGAS